MYLLVVQPGLSLVVVRLEVGRWVSDRLMAPYVNMDAVKFWTRHTFSANAAHPRLLGLLAHDEFIDSASAGIIGVDDRATMELRDRHRKKRGQRQEGRGRQLVSL